MIAETIESPLRGRWRLRDRRLPKLRLRRRIAGQHTGVRRLRVLPWRRKPAANARHHIVADRDRRVLHRGVCFRCFRPESCARLILILCADQSAQAIDQAVGAGIDPGIILVIELILGPPRRRECIPPEPRTR